GVVVGGPAAARTAATLLGHRLEAGAAGHAVSGARSHRLARARPGRTLRLAITRSTRCSIRERCLVCRRWPHGSTRAPAAARAWSLTAALASKRAVSPPGAMGVAPRRTLAHSLLGGAGRGGGGRRARRRARGRGGAGGLEERRRVMADAAERGGEGEHAAVVVVGADESRREFLKGALAAGGAAASLAVSPVLSSVTSAQAQPGMVPGTKNHYYVP